MRVKWLCDLRANAEKPFWRSDLATRTLLIESHLANDLLNRVHGESLVWLGKAPSAAQRLSRLRSIKCPVYVSLDAPEALETSPEGSDGPDAENSVATFPRIIGPLAAPGGAGIPAISADPDNLPFQSRSVDVVVIHHALEQVSDARTVLREASRILTPGGRLIVFGFNPWSLLGVRRGLASIIPDRVRQLRFVNPIRLFDWLTLLGFELDAPPAYGGVSLIRDRHSRRRVIPSASQLPFGGIVITSAVKQQASMHFKWHGARSRPDLAPVAYPKVAHWQRCEDDKA